jgi:hypothetical protein
VKQAGRGKAGGFIGRAFSPRVAGRAIHGAAPHAGIGRAVGAGGEVEGGRGGYGPETHGDPRLKPWATSRGFPILDSASSEVEGRV